MARLDHRVYLCPCASSEPRTCAPPGMSDGSLGLIPKPGPLPESHQVELYLPVTRQNRQSCGRQEQAKRPLVLSATIQQTAVFAIVRALSRLAVHCSICEAHSSAAGVPSFAAAASAPPTSPPKPVAKGARLAGIWRTIPTLKSLGAPAARSSGRLLSLSGCTAGFFARR